MIEQPDIPTTTPAKDSTSPTKLAEYGFRPITENDGDCLTCLLGIVRLPYAKLTQALGLPHSIKGTTDFTWTLWNEDRKEVVIVTCDERDAVRSDGCFDWNVRGLLQHAPGWHDSTLTGASSILAAYFKEVCGVEVWPYSEYVRENLCHT